MIAIVAVVLCGLMIFDSTRTMAYGTAGKDNKETSKETTVTVKTTADPNEEDKDSKPGVEKDETVYIITGADGTAEKVIVSDWLKNNGKYARISDVSALEDIENVKGDEEYLENGPEAGSWNADGNDIYYQGRSSKELPAGIKISYYLDGKQISPEELAGKSGKVRIRFDYENNRYETVEINGKTEKIYVPFAMLTGVLLDDSVFSDVEVTNGKIINDGNRTVAVGFALPGLKENLGLTNEKIDIPDYFELTADVTDFKLEATMTVATNTLFNRIDPDKLEGEKDIDFQGSADELTDAMNKLMNGSDELYEGLKKLNDATGELSDGVDKLANGAVQIADGAAAADNGAAQVADGAAQLSDGLATLDSNSAALNDGAKQVFVSLLATAQEQLTAAGLEVPGMTIDNYAEVLNGVIASLDEDNVYGQALAAVTAAVEEKNDYIEEQVRAAVEAEVSKGVEAAVREEVEKKVTEAVTGQVAASVEAAVTEQVTAKVDEAVKAEVAAKVEATVREAVRAQVIAAVTGMDMQAFAQAQEAGLVDAQSVAAIDAAVTAKMDTDELKATVTAKTDEQMKSAEVQALITGKTAEQMAADEVKAIISAKTAEQMASDEVKAIISTKTEEQMVSEEVTATVTGLIEQKMAGEDIQALIAQNVDAQKQKAITDNMAGEEVQSKLAAASAGAQKIIALKTSLDSYNTFYLGIGSYTDGVAKAAKGAASLKAGSAELSQGISALSEGAAALSEGAGTLNGRMPELRKGVGELCDGSKALADGLKEFDEKAVEKLVNLVNGDLKGIADRLKATADVSRRYNNYSGISDEMDGEVKFIYRTGSIG